MEVKTNKKKGTGINKGQLKKTIKNVICRPNSLFWPVLSKEQGAILQTELMQYKVMKPDFLKPHWKDIKSIPKENRPKCPAIERVEGTIFGIKTCCDAINNQECAAVIVESGVNPIAILQPVIEACTRFTVPVVCLEGLRIISEETFCIPTVCLGIKKDCLPNLSNVIQELAKKFPVKDSTKAVTDVNEKTSEPASDILTGNKQVIDKDTKTLDISMDIDKCPYLYRTGTTSRVFVPPSEGKKSQTRKDFAGQDFIEFSEKSEKAVKRKYSKMIVKRVANNPQRKKVKNK